MFEASSILERKNTWTFCILIRPDYASFKKNIAILCFKPPLQVKAPNFIQLTSNSARFIWVKLSCKVTLSARTRAPLTAVQSTNRRQSLVQELERDQRTHLESELSCTDHSCQKSQRREGPKLFGRWLSTFLLPVKGLQRASVDDHSSVHRNPILINKRQRGTVTVRSTLPHTHSRAFCISMSVARPTLNKYKKHNKLLGEGLRRAIE